MKHKPKSDAPEEPLLPDDEKCSLAICEFVHQAEPPIPDAEKRYYRPTDYYTDASYPGTFAERRVITFSERAKISYPSRNGLYVPEILLLQYCSYGTYPHPRNGYPGFWWFEYGIKNVGAYLDSLSTRGYLEYRSAEETLPTMTIPELKGLALSYGLTVKGKKAEIISAIVSGISHEELEAAITDRKYCLTQKGQKELTDNAYVPLMHSAPDKTKEGNQFGEEFNVWSINRILGENGWKDADAIIQSTRDRIAEAQRANYSSLRSRWECEAEKGDSLARELLAQDDQLEAIQAAEAAYKESGNIEAYILFWENIWNDGGLLFRGSFWTFRLADLYIKQKRYDDALDNLKKITADEYSDKKFRYIERIEKAQKKKK